MSDFEKGTNIQAVCSKCGKPNTEQTRFCVHCGVDLTQKEVIAVDDTSWTCLQCQETMSGDLAFCSNCGTKRNESSELKTPEPSSDDAFPAAETKPVDGAEPAVSGQEDAFTSMGSDSKEAFSSNTSEPTQAFGSKLKESDDAFVTAPSTSKQDLTGSERNHDDAFVIKDSDQKKISTGSEPILADAPVDTPQSADAFAPVSDQKANSFAAESGPAESAGQVTCPQCGKAAAPGTKFCNQCGTSLEKVLVGDSNAETKQFCPNCGKALKPDARFCSNCGTLMSSPGPARNQPVRRRKQPAPYVPREIPAFGGIREEKSQEPDLFAQNLPGWDIFPPDMSLQRSKR